MSLQTVPVGLHYKLVAVLKLELEGGSPVEGLNVITVLNVIKS